MNNVPLDRSNKTATGRDNFSFAGLVLLAKSREGRHDRDVHSGCVCQAKVNFSIRGLRAKRCREGWSTDVVDVKAGLTLFVEFAFDFILEWILDIRKSHRNLRFESL